jgi:chromosome segregation ATPase
MSLAKHKEGNVKERDRLKAEVEELNRRLAFHRSYADDVEKKRMEVENKNKELYRLLEESSTGAFKEKRFLESVQSQLAEMTTKYETELEDSNRFKALADQHHHATVQLSLQLAAVRTNLDKLTAQHNLTSLKLAKVNTDLENMTQLKEKITNQLNTKTNILKLKEDENHKFRLESAKLIKSKEMLMKKMMSVEQLKSGLENEVTKLK